MSLTKKDAAEKKQSKWLERVFVHAPGQNPDQLKAGAAFAKGTLLARCERHCCWLTHVNARGARECRSCRSRC